MKIISQIDDFRVFRENLGGKSIGLVPTMGALHDGHLSLVRLSINKCDVTVVTIFLNPAQFSKNEDLSTYPVNIEQDKDKLMQYNVDAFFIPIKSSMYHDDHSTYINEFRINKINEGRSRPLFFQGVLTIISKLFNIVQPSHAFFGKKDAQQLIIIKNMVRDLNYNVNIISCPTIRENNGLAMSSRNQYLNEYQKDESKIIYQSLCEAIKNINSGELSVKIIKKNIELYLNHKELKIDYISIVKQNSFTEIHKIYGDIIILVAVLFYDIRLIDNIYHSVSSK